MKSNNASSTNALKVGDNIELYGGYYDDPLYLKNPAEEKRTGVVIQFIPEQNKSATVVRLNKIIKGDSISGNILILRLRYVGQTWETPSPVGLELCDFMPEIKNWANRRHGEYVEAAASIKIIHSNEPK